MVPATYDNYDVDECDLENSTRQDRADYAVAAAASAPDVRLAETEAVEYKPAAVAAHATVSSEMLTDQDD